MKKQTIILLALAIVCCFSFINATWALMIGLTFALIVGNQNQEKTNLWGGYLLKTSVIGLGFGINIQVLAKAGQENIGTTAFFVLGVLTLGFLLGKLLKLDKTITLLISAGTAICGGSAIAAVGSVIKADANQLSVSTGVVFLLNAVALFVFPSIGHWLGLSQEQFGTWVAIAIHDTSSVVGAAAKYGDIALSIASITKMLRIIWIIPLSLILVFGISESRESFKIPSFIIGFVLASCFFSFLPIYKSFYQLFYHISKQMMVVSLYLIGTGISIENIRKVGRKVLFQAVGLWLIVCIVSLYFVTHFQH
ncbi:hypothetical protein EMA8858_02633 [Emticicia aquatica]|uniref:Sulfate exporter family transporter n=1 Tax=Emticicia aquatica TaxID=1681835 RepID=A0ABM9ARI1_9BACT|nr:putative sulfate exporter family transporter [Emticicia aquatica]CAH0996501.1 hypothetical protein EMA8858_02633 [Emticicia aquatica]